MSSHEPQVGDRVRILKDAATVRYIGPVVNQEGTWIGVEWDDVSRGKHDGSTGGVKYFSCAAPGNAGSFVRMEKVSFGMSVAQALVARYTNQLAEFGEEVGKDELYVHTSRQRRVEVRLVGSDKIQAQQSNTQCMVAARLVGLDVSHVVSGASMPGWGRAGGVRAGAQHACSARARA